MGEEPERLREIRYLCEQWMSVPNLPDNAIPASPDDVLWLLAEVERLAGERDEALVERDELADYIEGSQAECERLAGELKEESRLVETAWRQRDDETMKAMRAEAERERLAGRVATLTTALQPFAQKPHATAPGSGLDTVGIYVRRGAVRDAVAALADVGGSE